MQSLRQGCFARVAIAHAATAKMLRPVETLMGTLEPIGAGRARRRPSCWSILEAMTWNLTATSRASAGVGWPGGGAGGPAAPPVARSRPAPLPPGPPAAPACLPVRGQRRARVRALTGVHASLL